MSIGDGGKNWGVLEKGGITRESREDGVGVCRKKGVDSASVRDRNSSFLWGRGKRKKQAMSRVARTVSM